MSEPDFETGPSSRFDAISATHGAASVALIAFLTISGLLIIFEKFEDPTAIGVALVIIACLHLASLGWIGRIARPNRQSRRFSFRAASHGASALCICAFIACAGVVCIVQELQKSQLVAGVCLLITAACSLFGFLSFGWASNSRNLDGPSSSDV